MATLSARGGDTLAVVGLRRTRPRAYEEWKALRDWGRLPDWEPLRAGFELRAAREAAGVTQAELAARLGVSQQAVARAEQAGSNPTAALLEAWSRVLGARVRLEIVPEGRPKEAADRRKA
ncbi:MAG: helix-turn-helix transcriptional regulator [Thermoanaerobaculia bacterium]